MQYEIKHIDAEEIKKGIPQATLRNTFVYTKREEEVKNQQVDKQPKPNVSPDKPTRIQISTNSFLLEDDDNIIIS